MSKTPKQRAMALIAEHGGELIDDSYGHQLQASVWSPPGRQWIDGVGGHSLTVHAQLGDYADAWLGLIERLKPGTEPCTSSDCDTCMEAGLICDREARKGTGSGMCGRRLDEIGQCDRASDHVEAP